MKPSPRPAALAAASILRPIWLAESSKTGAAGSTTAVSSGMIACRAWPPGRCAGPHPLPPDPSWIFEHGDGLSRPPAAPGRPSGAPRLPTGGATHPSAPTAARRPPVRGARRPGRSPPAVPGPSAFSAVSLRPSSSCPWSCAASESTDPSFSSPRCNRASAQIRPMTCRASSSPAGRQ